ncbi:MAG: glucosaminidase domain-containing protein [Firmicutes bacterium]|nr:glucosaminidase domain-containing protein [Bacillota bacterium]
MKLEDKTIEQITAIFDKEIAELEDEIKHAGEDALNAVTSGKADAGSEAPAVETEAGGPAVPETATEADEQPIVVEELVGDEKPVEADPVVEEVEPADENQPVVDESASEEPPVVDEESEAADDIDDEAEPDDEDAAPEEPSVEEIETEEATEDEPAADDEPETEETPAVAADPVKDSNVKTVLTALGYILAVAAVCVLSVVCMNLLDKQLQTLKPVTPPDIAQSNLAASLQAYTANEVIAQQAVPQPTLQQIYAMDLRQPSGATEADLKRVSKAGLVGLEDTFLQAEKQYGVNAIFLMSIASLESAHGTMMYRPNNMFGYGGKSYPSKEACIMDVASGLSSKYLKPGASLYGGSPTLAGVNKRYAANPQWYAKVGKYMKSYYDVIAPYHNQNLNKIK